jgi:hypothetical protein
MKPFINILTLYFLVILIFPSCENKRERPGSNKVNQPTDESASPKNGNSTGYGQSYSEDSEVPQNTSINQQQSISKVTFFIENSGSMLGYVRKTNNYKSAIVGLSYSPDFDNSKKEFYFINGTNNKIKKSKFSQNLIGTDPELLKDNLNQSSFNKYGDIRFSDLTQLFEKALSCAKGSEISILVSDCIYDVGEEADPLTALKIETEKTKKVFRDRMKTENIQTIIIKAESQFEGNYYFASKKGAQYINQKRPYYIIIFGDSRLLNKHFNEENITKIITGYVSMARFLKIDNLKIPYQSTSQNSKGKFKFDITNKNKLTNAEKDRHGKGFQFTIAVDYSSLPFQEAYYNAKENYSLSGAYTILDIYTPTNQIHEVKKFTPSHLITIHTSSNPYGNIELNLKYIIPKWIKETSSVIESDIIGDVKHTYGFKYLTDAITEAYQYKNNQQNIGTFKIEILK